MTDAACPPGAEPDAKRGAPEIVVITGMSGAGRSEAIHTFEDFGFFCIDNLPPSFLPQLVTLAELPGSRINRIAVVCDVRAQEFFESLAGELDGLDDRGVQHRLLFLEADDDTLLRRFKASRRRHPLCDETGGSLAEGIASEREDLQPLRARADVVIDTSDIKSSELRRRLYEEFVGGPMSEALAVTITSFGFKYGPPSDADLVMDVRFLPNPFYDPALRPLTGLDRPVTEFVMDRPETTEFLDRWFALLDTLVPGYVAEGKHHLSIAMGCTGGQHRSVALAEATGVFLRGHGYRAVVSHRDIGRDRTPE